ncbi:MAG TPA: DUF4870 domain-containing protein [Verrucomicrobiae bacterium]|nr:DUF4870 domain-containing protein [Verrucomicrobiae bacterium]
MTDPSMPPVSPPSQLSQQEIDSGKTMAILSYIPIAFIGLIVAIVCVATKNNAYSLYHAKQALTLYIGWIVAVLCCIPLFLICIGFPLVMAVNVCALVLCILGIINSSSGQCKPLPFIGQFADKWFGNIQKV